MLEPNDWKCISSSYHLMVIDKRKETTKSYMTRQWWQSIYYYFFVGQGEDWWWWWFLLFSTKLASVVDTTHRDDFDTHYRNFALLVCLALWHVGTLHDATLYGIGTVCWWWNATIHSKLKVPIKLKTLTFFLNARWGERERNKYIRRQRHTTHQVLLLRLCWHTREK